MGGYNTETDTACGSSGQGAAALDQRWSHLIWVWSGELEFTKTLSRWKIVFQGTEASMGEVRSGGWT